MQPDRFLDIYRQHVAELYRAVSRRVSADRALAEDVVQEVFLRAVSTWPRDGVPDEPRAWLHAVAMNLIRNQSRRAVPVGLEGDVASGAGAEEALGGVELDALQAGLARLPDPQARLLTERHVDGESLARLAERHGVSERAIEGRLHRARSKLRGLVSPGRRGTDDRPTHDHPDR